MDHLLTTSGRIPAKLLPWTREELTFTLRRAGWIRITGPAAVYVSPDGLRLNLDEYRRPWGILWKVYADWRQLPRDGDGIISAADLPRAVDPLRPMALSLRSEQVLRAVIDFKHEHAGDSPTVREIMSMTGISSTSVVHYHLNHMARMGVITRDGGRIGIPGSVWTFEEGGV